MIFVVSFLTLDLNPNTLALHYVCLISRMIQVLMRNKHTHFNVSNDEHVQRFVASFIHLFIYTNKQTNTHSHTHIIYSMFMYVFYVLMDFVVYFWDFISIICERPLRSVE